MGVGGVAEVFEGGADVGGMGGGGGIEGEGFEAGGEAFDLVAVVVGAGGFGGAVEELGEDYGGDAEAGGIGVEAGAEVGGATLWIRMQRFLSSM